MRDGRDSQISHSQIICFSWIFGIIYPDFKYWVIYSFMILPWPLAERWKLFSMSQANINLRVSRDPSSLSDDWKRCSCDVSRWNADYLLLRILWNMSWSSIWKMTGGKEDGNTWYSSSRKSLDVEVYLGLLSKWKNIRGTGGWWPVPTKWLTIEMSIWRSAI